MWVEVARLRTQIPYLLAEVAIRVFLLLMVCILQVHVKPHIHHITEIELTNCMRPRKDSFVPPWMMVMLIVFVPLVLLCLPYLLAKNRNDTVQALLAWTLALSINGLVTEVVKLVVGRPRPDYFYRCYPSGVKETHCTGNIRDVMEGRKSFPSGHSSFSFCSMGFISLWLCGRLGVLSHRRGEGLRVLACLIPLVLASIVALSRCADNHHHWEDVVVGSIMGFVSSYICYRQYYNSLESDLSGCPYMEISDSIDDFTDIEVYQCCSQESSIESIKIGKKNS